MNYSFADRVVLKRSKPRRLPRGHNLTSAAQEKPQLFEVIAVGPGGMVDGHEIEMTVEPGNKIITGKYSGTQVKVDGEEYTIVRQSDILAIVE
jgi:chaperonin GroES